MKLAIDRVLAKVSVDEASGCWIFTGALNPDGYGIAGLGGRGDGVDRTHRIVYRSLIGEIPDGLFVLHRCDVRACCNPAHLFTGTAKDNTQDMLRKNRGSAPPRNVHDRGSYRYNAKLNEALVAELRERVSNGETKYSVWKWMEAELGSYGRKPAYRMLSGETWRHVK